VEFELKLTIPGKWIFESRLRIGITELRNYSDTLHIALIPVDGIPRNTSGKLDRARLNALAARRLGKRKGERER
jgi:hypothetical protein